MTQLGLWLALLMVGYSAIAFYREAFREANPGGMRAAMFALAAICAWSAWSVWTHLQYSILPS